MDGTLYQSWRNLLAAWAEVPALADEMFADMCANYSGPGRFYHTLDHVEAVLNALESVESHARDLPALKLAAWLHDVIYDSRAQDNEEQSAGYAVRWCERLSISAGQRVASLILKTKSHDAEGDTDAQLLIDADLSILGASEAVYRAYAENIRREYAWAPEPDYRAGRRRVLEHFLAKPRIFHFLVQLESPARQNLSAEIDRLRARSQMA